MSSTIRCDIVSAEQEIFHGEATLVVATGELGELGIAPRHAPLITRLKPGKVVVTLPDGSQVDIAISGGILEVQPQVVTVLADTAIRAEDIDEAAVRKAKEEAERVLANRSEAMEVAEAQQRLAEVTAQLQALERLRRNLKHCSRPGCQGESDGPASGPSLFVGKPDALDSQAPSPSRRAHDHHPPGSPAAYDRTPRDLPRRNGRVDAPDHAR